MKKLIHWCTKYIAPASVLFFLAFIPLYPKLPLINVIRTWVYIRLEDFLAAAAIGTYILWRIVRRRIPKTPLTWPIILYWTIGFVSAIYSILFIGPKLTGYFPHLVILHFLRRIEYMTFFFIAFDVVARKKSLVTAMIWTLAATSAGIILYGFGQKLFGFPAFLTMNEEFAKGIPLRLPPTARIPSTFGGHYDLAAFIVLTIPVLMLSAFAAKKIWQKIVFTVLSAGSLVMLLLTQSRTSFLVYLAGVSAAFIWYRKKWWLLAVIPFSFFMLNFVAGASERFYKTFRYSDVIVDLSTGRPVGTLASLEGGTAVIKKSESPAKESLPTGSQYIGLASASGTVKTVSYASVALASGSGEIATVSGSFLIQKALVYDISITTRLQAEWPNAFAAFKRNVLLGSGYSTLNVASDGDYIRMLGETGVAGSLGFLGIILAAYVLFFRKLHALEGYEKAFVIGVFGGLTGLLLNAILIDVFEASKVAFTFWLLLGAATAVLSTAVLSVSRYLKWIWKALTSDVAFLFYALLTVGILFGSSVTQYFIGDDFTWLKWAASSGYADILRYFTDAQGFFYRPIPKLWYFVLYAIFWLKPEGYHVMTLILYGLSTYVVYLIARRVLVHRGIAILAALLFASLSVHHENVFWISGASSLLATTFLFAAVWAALAKRRMFSYLFMVAAMLSYDGMIVAPVIVAVLEWSALPLIAVPAYWWLRTVSGAVWPSGDYGYKLSALPFNVIGNAVGYFAGTFIGPRFIEWWAAVREYLRQERLLAAALGVPLVSVAAYFVWKLRSQKEPLTWFALGFISLAAYLGLGNASERYALAASGFFIIGAAKLLIEKKWLLVSLFTALIVWNAAEVTRVAGDWKKASDISKESLSIMNRQFFPLRENKSFIFIDTPIRVGRAWVFPTGLNDALWHIFHLSPYRYTTTNVPTKDAAYEIPVPQGFAAERFIFENYQLKRLVRVGQ